MTPAERICAELRDLGYEPRSVRPDGCGCELAVIDYDVQAGRHRHTRFKIGIGFQEDAYPEYPPHWICVADLHNPRIPVHSSFRYDAADWSVFSVPPSDFWDSLSSSDKNMTIYLRRHVPRFWEQV